MKGDVSCKLDWFSYTVPLVGNAENDGEDTRGLVLKSVCAGATAPFLICLLSEPFAPASPHGFFKYRMVQLSSGISISYGGKSNYALVELSGRPVDYILDRVAIPDLVASAEGRCTRVDFAVDIETDTSPEEFVAQREGTSFESVGQYTSGSGTTCYIGSRKSDRMARCYRYNPPHPRSLFLRVEAEFKGDAAKNASRALLINELVDVCAAVHEVFGWAHPDFKLSSGVAIHLQARSYSRAESSRLIWLNSTCAAAIRKAAKEGLISLEDWIAEHLKS